MPIRMVEDEPGNNSSNQSNNRQSSGKRSFAGGKLGGSLGNILGALLPFLIKKPKILIPVLIVGGLIWYFFLRE